MRNRPPRATVALGAVTVFAYFVVAAAGMSVQAAQAGGFVAARLSGLVVPGALPLPLTPLSATLLHGGLVHLGFNLLILVYCGREDEVALGPGALLFLYAVGAYAAAAAQYLAGPASTVPMIGASGAVSALVGAYAILYGQRRASSLPPAVARWLHVLWLAAAWIAVQLLLGLASATAGMAVATAAHIGGFVAGLFLARPLLRWRYRRA